jgi:hypothetical protein
MAQPRFDPIVEALIKRRRPVTVKNYLDLDWAGAPPKPLPAEFRLEAERAVREYRDFQRKVLSQNVAVVLPTDDPLMAALRNLPLEERMKIRSAASPMKPKRKR